MDFFNTTFQLLITLLIFIITTYILYLNVKKDWQQNNPFIYMWGAVVAIYFLPTFFDILQQRMAFEYLGSTHSYNLETIMSALLYFLFFIFVYYIGGLIFEFALPLRKVDLQRIKSNDEKGVLFVVGLIGLTLFGVFILYRMFGGRVFSLGFVEARDTVPAYLTFLVQGLPKLYIGIILWLAVVNRKFLAILLSVLLTAIFFGVGGTRQNLVQILLCAFLYFVYFWDVRAYKKISIVALGILGGVLIFSISKLLRNSGSLDERLELLVAGFDVFEVLSGIGEFFVRGVYYDFIEKYSAVTEFGKMQYFLRTLLFWLPSSFSGGIKPDDFEYVMFWAFNGTLNATMHPTLPGSIFADSGPLFWCWSLLLAGVRHYVQFILSREGGIRLAVGYVAIAMSCIMIGRGALYAAILTTLFMSILLHLYAMVSELAAHRSKLEY